MKLFTEKTYRILFLVSIIFKGIVSLGEIFLGVMFCYFNYAQLASIAFLLTGDELTESPHDLFWRYAIHAFDGFSATGRLVWAFIFLSHGIIKIALAIGLIKGIRWTYPVAAVVFGLFAIYQGYQYVYSPSFVLGAITVFDIVTIWLIMHEYKTKSRFGILSS